ncbi:MAG: glycosyltransferase family 4 protein [Planctomycetes bacterium]|nr:glycosyltransferase family 4 protein [Planctomycetota bacterium]MBM4057237.1 glycosyltransferase family 4 protein [Planctomycetota bacterium]
MTAPRPRIVVDLEKLRHINCGLGRFSLHLAQELLAIAAGRFEPVFFLPAGADRHFPANGFDRIAVAPWKKEALRRLLRPLVGPFLGEPRIALWHVTNQMSKYLPLDPRVPVVLTIHDLNFLHEAPHDEQVGKITRKLADIQGKIDRAAAVVTDSRFVADDVAGRLQLGGRPIHVVPLGLPPPKAAAAERPAWLPPEPFLLTVGNCLAHKNFHVLLDLVEQLADRRLVIAGKKATPYGEFLGREVSRRRLEGRVILPGEVSDADRQWLYEHCEAFVFPSLTEGFGFPVLEAMQAGRPVLMARTTCLPEIAGDHGFYLDSFDPAAMAAIYAASLDAFAADPDFAPRARAHAATFSWGATARGYARVYESVLGQKAP